MRPQRNEPKVCADMRAELDAAFDNMSHVPTVAGVIDETVMDVARELRESAVELESCGGADTCGAKAIYLRYLADGYDPQGRATR